MIYNFEQYKQMQKNTEMNRFDLSGIKFATRPKLRNTIQIEQVADQYNKGMRDAIQSLLKTMDAFGDDKIDRKFLLDALSIVKEKL